MEKLNKEIQPYRWITKNMRVCVGRYEFTGTIYVGLEDPGDCDECGDLTYCLGGLDDPFLAYLDTKNGGEDVIKYVEERGLAEFTGRYGYCAVDRLPLYRFNFDALNKADPEGTERFVSYLQDAEKRKEGRKGA